MQDLFQDFSLWLLKFLAVSTGLIAAATLWTARRRKNQKLKNSDLPPSDGNQPENALAESIQRGERAFERDTKEP